MAQPEFLATPARNPIENGTFGAIDAFVRVELPSPGRHTRLEVPYSRENARHVDERSLRLFVWDEASRSLVLVNASGVDPERRVVWGVIDASGLYGAIGLPRDPDLLRDGRRLFAVFSGGIAGVSGADSEGLRTDFVCAGAGRWTQARQGSLSTLPRPRSADRTSARSPTG